MMSASDRVMCGAGMEAAVRVGLWVSVAKLDGFTLCCNPAGVRGVRVCAAPLCDYVPDAGPPGGFSHVTGKTSVARRMMNIL